MNKIFIRYLLIPHLMAALLSLACFLGFALYFQVTYSQPSQETYTQLAQENRDAKIALQDMRTRVSASKDAIKISDQLAVMDQKIADAPNQAVLVAEINTFVRRSNVVVLHGDNRIATDTDEVVWFHQELTVEGTYDSIRYFLELLSGSDRLNVIQEVSWKAAGKGQQKARVKLATMFRGG